MRFIFFKNYQLEMNAIQIFYKYKITFSIQITNELNIYVPII